MEEAGTYQDGLRFAKEELEKLQDFLEARSQEVLPVKIGKLTSVAMTRVTAKHPIIFPHLCILAREIQVISAYAYMLGYQTHEEEVSEWKQE